MQYQVPFYTHIQIYGKWCHNDLKYLEPAVAVCFVSAYLISHISAPLRNVSTPCRERVTPLVKSCRSPGPTPSTKLKQPETEALEHFFHQNQRTGQLLILENTAKLMKTRWKYTFKEPTSVFSV